MKTLSMLQPWATLAILGFKQWETRSRNIGIPLGLLLIHASARVDNKLGFEVYSKFQHQFPVQAKRLPAWKEMVRGAIIGLVDVKTTMSGNLIRPGPLSEMEALLGNYNTATYFARFCDPHPVENPVPAKGHLGIWDFPLIGIDFEPCPPDRNLNKEIRKA
jgi:hypothetical protein